jgi:hypothetical protein
MNLRNGKQTAVNKVAAAKERGSTKERAKEFIEELDSAFSWAEQYDHTPYVRVCAYRELFVLVLGSIDEFKDMPKMKILFDSIQHTSLEMLTELRELAIIHGKDREFMRAINRLRKVLMTVLDKYAA